MTFVQHTALNSAHVAPSWQLCFVPQALEFYLEHQSCLPLLQVLARRGACLLFWLKQRSQGSAVKSHTWVLCPHLTPAEELWAPVSSCPGAGTGSLCPQQPWHARSTGLGQGLLLAACGAGGAPHWCQLGSQFRGWCSPTALPASRHHTLVPDRPHFSSWHLTSVSMQPEAQDGSSVCKQRWHSWKSTKSSKIKPTFKFTWLVHNPCAKQGSRQDVVLRAAAAQQQILQVKLNHAGPRWSKNFQGHSLLFRLLKDILWQ